MSELGARILQVLVYALYIIPKVSRQRRGDRRDKIRRPSRYMYILGCFNFRETTKTTIETEYTKKSEHVLSPWIQQFMKVSKVLFIIGRI